ncbi:replication initiation factor domain-containing protein [Streptococcus suis]|nr:replication initiation factor domain-containing protein [Streptococcus suis]MDW8766566.1 replication initiation factor domain-containing protein [Streptococcus suis]NQG30176.1 hypothetical protein [Streptococcus suis]NQJ20752.1 hypothetical protein [Streptococcus suis]NQK58791.1 hypothetical protein [Streptococcus suis]NQL93502.1 hypothetical protein [Streptococcus suis]
MQKSYKMRFERILDSYERLVRKAISNRFGSSYEVAFIPYEGELNCRLSYRVVTKSEYKALFCGVVSDYITFLDNEKGNMIPSSWWLTFVGENSKIQLKAPKRTINIMNTLNWVDRSILGTLTGLQMISNELGIDFYQILKNSSKRDSNACRRLLEEFDRLGTQEKRRIREKRISSLSGFEY